MKKLVMVLAALSFFISNATADIIIFTSGGAKEGIVQEETPTSVKMRVKSDADVETLKSLTQYSPVYDIVSKSLPVEVSVEKT